MNGVRFGGSGKLDNLVAMGGNTVNLGSYKKLENIWEAALRSEPPQEVYVKIDRIIIYKNIRSVKNVKSRTSRWKYKRIRKCVIGV
ncbi:MAG: hypothetical protein GX287_07305 [Fusobacteria bacterium]|nr:hypothetical protein [Fusobacteriota bacterium]